MVNHARQAQRISDALRRAVWIWDGLPEPDRSKIMEAIGTPPVVTMVEVDTLADQLLAAKSYLDRRQS